MSALVLNNIAKILVNDVINSFFSPSDPIVSSNSACKLFAKFSIKVKGPSVEFSSLLLSSAFSPIFCLFLALKKVS